MSMSEAQNAAFKAASGFSPAVSNLFWESLAMAVITFWLAWVAVSLYKGWANQNLKAAAAKAAFIRALMIYLAMSWLVLH